MPPVLVPFNGEIHPSHLAWDDFVDNCLEGNFIDFDGFGKLATDTHVSDVQIRPSQVVRGFHKPDWVTHVVWYNR
jgi:hypothetical protein